MDAITLFKPVTKWNWSIRNPQNIPEIVRRAFKISLEEKPGATHIELPQDVAKKEADIPPIEPQPVFRSEPNEQLIKQAVKLILEAKNPVIFLGNGCVRENASPHIRKFVEKTGIIAMNTFMGKGVVSDDSPLHLHTIGIKDADHALLAMKSADVVIAVGVDLVEYSPKNWNLDFSKKIIHIDFTPSEVYTYYRPIVEIVSDIGYAVDAILEELELQKRSNPELEVFPRKEIPELFKKIINEVDGRRDSFNDDTSFPIRPEKLVIDVRNALGENDIVLSDVGAHKLWISKIYKTYQPNTCLIPNGFCSMGFAFPGAIAAKMVYPDRNVVAMCGDAGFLMNVQELETAVRLKLSVITIVWCDRDLGMISMKQKNEFGKSVFTKFTNPDFIKLAESFGAVGYVAKSTEDFEKILEDAKKIKDAPIIIAIDVDYSRNNVLLNDSHYENV